MATLNYSIRSSRKSDQSVPIIARLKAGRNYDKRVKTGLTVIPEHWSQKTGFVKATVEKDNDDGTNNKLRAMETFILNALPKNGELSEDWLEKTIENFHNPLPKNVEERITLFKFIRDFIDKAPTRPNPKTGRPVCYKMIREYERTFEYLQEFCKKKRKTYDFQDITLGFYHDFSLHLTKKNLATNTIGKKIQTLKIFLNAATDAGYNAYTHFKSHRFASISEDTDSIHLNEQEIKAMYELDLTNNPRLDRVRDLFLVGAWTGLRFSDWDQVKHENIEDGLLIIRQSKTGGKVYIPLHPMVESILEKYEGILPPVLTNQKINEYIKEVGELAKIKAPFKRSITRGGKRETTIYEKWQVIGTHTARRSFATNAYNAGVPSLTIMAITGHKTETSFLKYIKVTPKEHALKLSKIRMESAKTPVFKGV